MNPLHLLHLEWKKFSPNGTFRVLAIFYIVFYILAVYLAFRIGAKATFSANGSTINPTQDLFLFPRSWELVAYEGRWLNVIVLGYIGVFMITLEWSHRTLRQNIIAGLSRREVFTAKINAILALAAGATGCYLILGAVSGLANSDTASLADALPPLDGVLRYFLQAAGYLLLGTLAGLFIRQTALATVIYFAYVIFLESVFRWILNLTVLKTKILLFLPDSVLESLIPFPIPKVAHELMGSQKIFDSLSPFQIWIAALAWLALFSVLLFQRLKKADL